MALLTETLLGKCREGFISITGAGGKTSLMQALARKAASMGLSVLITTTTKIQSPFSYLWDCDVRYTSEIGILQHEVKKGEVVLYGEKCIDIKKLQSPRYEILYILKKRFDLVICEADGSRGLPLKCHSDRDPVILDISDYTIAVFGGWALGEPAFGQVFGYEGSGPVDKAFLEGWTEDLLKASLDNKRSVVCNGCDIMTKEQIELFKSVVWPEGLEVLLSSVKEDRLYD